MSATGGDRRPHFTLGGIPVRVEPFFLGVIAFLGLGQPGVEFVASWIAIATVSILLHEMGHAVAFRYFGLSPRITLHGLGGLTSAPMTPAAGKGAFTPSKRIVASLSGPLSALIILGLPALAISLANGFDPWATISNRALFTPVSGFELILSQIIWINVGWSLLNLVPILPLDGGNVMLSTVELLTKRDARRIANAVSIGIGLLIGVVSLTTGYIFGVVLAAMFVGLNAMELTRKAGAAAPKGELQLVEAQRALIDYEPQLAERLARTVLAEIPSAETWRSATEIISWSRLAQGDVAGAYFVLQSMPPGLLPSASLRGALALASGNTREGVATLAWAFTHDTYDSAKIFGAIAAGQSGQAVAVANELALMGREGLGAGRVFQGLLDYAGFKSEAAEVDQIISSAMPSPPGWS